MKVEYLSVVDVSNAFCVYLGGGRDDMDLFTIMVNVYYNRIIPIDDGQAGDKVYAHCLPRSVRDIVRL